METILLKPQEAADLLRISRSKMYSLIAAGEVPTVEIGTAQLIPREALRVWINERVQKPARQAEPD